MTVKLHDGNGSETVVRLSMQSVIALSTCFVIAVISGLVIWVYGIQCNVSTLQNKAAVFEQVDMTHKEMLIAVDAKLDKTLEKLDAIKDYQLRKDRRGSQ